MSKSEIFSERLVALRKRMGNLTQKQLAERMGCSRNYIYMLENGRDPGRKMVSLVSKLEENPHSYDIEAACEKKMLRVLSYSKVDGLGTMLQRAVDETDFEGVCILGEALRHMKETAESGILKVAETGLQRENGRETKKEGDEK